MVGQSCRGYTSHVNVNANKMRIRKDNACNENTGAAIKSAEMRSMGQSKV